MRILHQLGYEDALQSAAIPICNFLCRDLTGCLIHNNALYNLVQKNHGRGFLPFERQEFLQILYDGLPDKSYIRTNARVEGIAQLQNSVEAKLSDSSTETGDMVLGCDGVHSSTRSIMWDFATRVSPGLIQVKEKTSLKTSWKTLVLMTPTIPELGERDLSEDAQALADLVADIWRRRNRASVIALQEGVMEHWHRGRITLTGDTVHKAQVHPNLAFGGNSAIGGVVTAINHIQRAVEATRGCRPSSMALSAAFATYESEQRQRLKGILEMSNWVAKMHTYVTYSR
ncbi:hypothetical protein F4810DRAFT_710064 [Camillea tinctor]|nr:hypothetical protein F4810DRAFT_710064 [Camillea tinctor]